MTTMAVVGVILFIFILFYPIIINLPILQDYFHDHEYFEVITHKEESRK